MRGSNLDRRITIQANIPVRDTKFNSVKENWVPIPNGSRVPASVQDELPSKSESVQQGMRIATRRARVRIRFRSDVTSEMRIIVHGAIERITTIIGGPAEIGRREWLELLVEDYSVPKAH